MSCFYRNIICLITKIMFYLLNVVLNVLLINWKK